MRAILKPRTDIGLLILRLAAGLSLFLVFGLPKLKDANSFLHTGHWGFVDFNRKLGLPLPLLVAFLQTVNESLGALLLVCGFQTQLAATSLAIGFAVATACSWKVQEVSWILAACYCVIFAALAFTGGGRYSFDGRTKS